MEDQFLRTDLVQLGASVPKAGTARSIYLGLREQIAGGVYRPGDRLPSTRALAEEFGVSRTTVTAAFEQLISEGYVSVHQGAKATVAPNAPNLPDQPARRPQGSAKKLSAYAMRAMGLPAHLPGETALKYDFRYGDVAPEDFPKLIWRKALTTAVIARRARLGYGHPAGSIELRLALQGYLWRARGIRCQAEQIVVTNGSQQALDLCARVLVSPGDRVLIEEPCYSMARNVFVTLGAQATLVACDADGLNTDMLPNPFGHALAFVTPSHQFPLGGVLAVDRRRHLVAWAEAADAHIIEDDYDGEYRYDVHPVPPLYLSGRDRVVYIGTVSKTLSPTLRLGYLVLPEGLVEPFVRCKQITDRHGATFEQEALASLIVSGAYERHVRKMRRLNSARRIAFLTAMQQAFGEKVEIVGTSAGLHVVVWFNGIDRLEEQRLAATAFEAGIGIYPISHLFLRDTERRAGFVFGYASIALHKIAEGVKLLSGVLAL